MDDMDEQSLEVVEATEEEAVAEADGEEPKEKQTKLKVKFAAELHRDEALVYFQSILDGLRRGKLQLKQGSKLLELAPSETLEIEVKAAKKSNKEKLTIELAWTGETGELEVS